MTRDVYGADLRADDIIVQAYPDGSVDVHRIDHLSEYPTPPAARRPDDPAHPNTLFGCGLAHARIAYDSADEAHAGWRHTCADHEPFHILTEDQ
jgi:hypothetical protein